MRRLYALLALCGILGCMNRNEVEYMLIHRVPVGYRGLLTIQIDESQESDLVQISENTFQINYSKEGYATVKSADVFRHTHTLRAEYMNGKEIPRTPVDKTAIGYYPLTDFGTDGKSYSLIGTYQEQMEFWRQL